jgi:hypothetical protein
MGIGMLPEIMARPHLVSQDLALITLSASLSEVGIYACPSSCKMLHQPHFGTKGEFRTFVEVSFDGSNAQ